MPRVTISKKKYKVADLSKYIIGEMKVQKITQEQIARELGLTQQSFSYRLSKSLFSYADLLTIFKILGTSDETKIKLMTL